MAYKFQFGPATLSGSLTQDGNITGEGNLALANSATIGCAADADLITLANTSVSFAANADVNIAKAGGLQIGGAAVTSTAAELNKLDGAGADVTAAKLTTLSALSDAEIGYLDAAVAGTAAASKVVVLDGSKNIATIGTIGCGAITSTGASSMGSLDVGGALTCDTSFAIDSTVISAAEIGVLDSVTAGTVAAGKALVADASTLVKFANGSLNGYFSASDTDNAIQMGASQNASIYYNTAQMEGLVLAVSSSEGGVVSIMAGESQNAVINLTADEHDDAGDMWEIACQASNDKFTLSNDIASQGTMVEHFSITPHATVAQSTAAFAGHVTVAGNLTVSGTTTTVDTDNLVVKDKLITLNDGGGAASAGASGIEFEEDGSATGFIKTASDRAGFEFQAPGNSNTLTIDATATKTLTVGGNFNIDADITTPAANINLLTAGAGSSVSVQGADGIIIFDNDDSNNAKKVLVSDITATAQRLDVASIDNLGTGSTGVNYWAALGGAETMRLPNAPTVGDSIKIKAPSNCSTSNSITISPLNASHRIDEQTSIVLESPNAAVELVYVVNNHWKIF